ncbi:glycosyl transferase [Amycolatopsis sp. A1MSW2902]|uniref:glycosyltransferase n=1 Tax=Amycolatopsis sp. A1MSW2902 TaxID=687413 RepID=UPI00307EFD9C
MRILLWHVHGSWTDAFVRGRHEYFVPASPEGAPWGLGLAGRDWPGVTEVPVDRLADARPDVVVLQRPEEAAFVRPQLGSRVPMVYVEHNAPRHGAAVSRHPMAGQDEVPIVHVTSYNALMWDNGIAPVVVIPHGIPDPGERYTGELPAGAAMINEPRRRARVTGADLLPAFREIAPVNVFGMGTDGLPGGQGDVRPPRLHDELARHRVYLHTARWTSLGLSLLEAMHLGMPIVAVASTEAPAAVPPDAGVCSADIEVLARRFRELVHEPDFAVLAGKAAREHALAHFGLDAFLERWDRLLTETAPAAEGV